MMLRYTVVFLAIFFQSADLLGAKRSCGITNLLIDFASRPYGPFDTPKLNATLNGTVPTDDAVVVVHSKFSLAPYIFTYLRRNLLDSPRLMLVYAREEVGLLAALVDHTNDVDGGILDYIRESGALLSTMTGAEEAPSGIFEPKFDAKRVHLFGGFCGACLSEAAKAIINKAWVTQESATIVLHLSGSFGLFEKKDLTRITATEKKVMAIPGRTNLPQNLFNTDFDLISMFNEVETTAAKKLLSYMITANLLKDVSGIEPLVTAFDFSAESEVWASIQLSQAETKKTVNVLLFP